MHTSYLFCNTVGIRSHACEVFGNMHKQQVGLRRNISAARLSIDMDAAPIGWSNRPSSRCRC